MSKPKAKKAATTMDIAFHLEVVRQHEEIEDGLRKELEQALLEIRPLRAIEAFCYTQGSLLQQALEVLNA